jgi:class 3 adenylate cyclase/predicted ATPase
MAEIADWLGKVGLGQYAQAFAENDIDFSILPELTDADLEKIGVASLGHRRKLLHAIAEIGNAPQSTSTAQAAPSTAAAAIPSVTAAPLAPQQAAGERRYLTVMFCDLVGSTGISAQLDAEEWRDLVGSYLDAASAAVTEMGGHVAKKLGDGILALFGYPIAHENDAERAARAALTIQRALAELNRNNAGTDKPELQARIGLETGPAVVDAAGEIYGDVANIAARLQALADPDSILITAQVQRQIAGLFVAEEHGTHTLKGVPEPTVLFKLIRASGGGRRSGQRNLTPLVGRNDEMAMLTRRWERARTGEGQLVLIVGEPGLGKSRLIEEFHARLSETPHTWVEWSCSQLLQNTPLHPIAEWGRQRFGGADVPVERRLAELESSLAQVKLDAAENVSLLAPLLDIPLPAERAPKLSGEELRRRQLAALTNWLMAGAKAQPVVLAFEDLHWADPTTLDVLRGIAERGALAPLLIVATTRPEFRPPWSMRSHHGTISLAPLDRPQVHDMVAELSARHALPRDVVEDVAARTGGVPLFVEEVTRLLLDRGEGGGGIQSIPPTLQQSLMARLDRLGPAREIAQIGSVIGRGFTYRLLRDVAAVEDVPLQAALEKLADADIVLVQGLPPESDYRFKHALIQDAAYENLLKSRRQILHRGVAEILRDRFADTAAAEPEALAYHFTQAGMTDAAIEWWGKAGDQALRRSAFQEAISHLGKAIEMADKEGEGTPRATASASERLKLQTGLGRALMWSKGYTSEETKAAFARAQELAGSADDPSERFATYYGQWSGHLMRGQLNLALETATAFLRDAENAGRPTETAVASRIQGATRLYLGDLLTARVSLDEALRIHDPERDRDAKFRFGVDIGAVATVHLALAYWLLGRVDQAAELANEAAARAREIAHMPTETHVEGRRAILPILRGDAEAVLRMADSLLELAQQHGLSSYVRATTLSSTWAHARLGEGKESVAEFRQAIAAYADQANRLYLPFYQGLLAELEGERQSPHEALTRVDEALRLAQQTEERWTDALLHRIRGEILLKRDPANTAPAEEAFLTAIAVAQQQKAKSFELRAALSLAKLYESTARTTEAHAVLAPALEGFAPTPEFPEIEQAQSLLAALAETDEVKTATAARERRLKLQTSYGQALLWSRGMGADETKAAFARARELAAGIKNPTERFVTYFGQWGGSLMRGDFKLADGIAEVFLGEAERHALLPETAGAHRMFGLTRHLQGFFTQAQAHFAAALQMSDPQWDREIKLRFGTASPASIAVFLAHTHWMLGDYKQARNYINEALERAVEAAHPPTLANTYGFKAFFEVLRGDVEAARRAVESLLELSRDHGLAFYGAIGTIYHGWVRFRMGECDAGLAVMREGLKAHVAAGNKAYVPWLTALVAEAQSEHETSDEPLTRIDAAVMLAAETGEHWSDALLHRIRGEILLRRDPANTAPAEEAFLAAIAIAQQQKARSFELRAALSLAELYQNSNRAADAHTVLAPALEGFSPTPEFPEIEEARGLLAGLAD